MFESNWDISLDKNTITFRNYLLVLVQIGMSINLQGCIVPGILPVPRVIGHTTRPQLSANVMHKMPLRLCNRIDNAHYLSQIFRTVYVALQCLTD